MPELSGPQNPQQTFQKLACDYPDAKILFGGLGPKALTITQLPVGKQDTIVFIGPEGGLADSEKAFLIEHGALEIKLASNVLRVETAAIAFAAVLEALRAGSGN
jgi:RsmE family RNA methyltransferase